MRRLTTVLAEDTRPLAPVGTALHASQSAIRGIPVQRIAADTSLRFVQTLSQMSAIEFVAATLANNPGDLAETVIACDDDVLAMQLDACLHRYGLPTMGVSVSSKSHPVLQVLPLCLATLSVSLLGTSQPADAARLFVTASVADSTSCGGAISRSIVRGARSRQ